jgi:hypothetical protein
MARFFIYILNKEMTKEKITSILDNKITLFTPIFGYISMILLLILNGKNYEITSIKRNITIFIISFIQSLSCYILFWIIFLYLLIL